MPEVDTGSITFTFLKRMIPLVKSGPQESFVSSKIHKAFVKDPRSISRPAVPKVTPAPASSLFRRIILSEIVTTVLSTVVVVP